CPAAKPNGSQYYCEDKRLGPAVLPATAALMPLLAHYKQLGGLCPEEWLRNYTFTPGNGSYRYPLFEGFQLSTEGVPIEGEVLLPAGTLLDRFGPPSGRYLSPAYTPAAQRALPPSRFNPPMEYHVYEVLTELNVTAGTIAAAFGQPGQGTQYQLDVAVAELLGKNLTEIFVGVSIPPNHSQDVTFSPVHLVSSNV
ncbi:hypothetical protein DFH08DRAFT_690281, partial [Mycena albidolilacea]